MNYPITTIFRSLQGEGHFVGYPTTFIRLAGCSNIDCAIRAECDEAPWKMTAMLEHREILHRVRAESPAGIVCITGGEPTDHDLIPLVDALKEARFQVHIETSGIRSVAGVPFDWITVSPKTKDYIQRSGHTLKIIVVPGTTWGQIDDIDTDTTFFHRYLQPLTQPDGFSNIGEVCDMLQTWENHRGRWALSTQAHKTWKLP